MPGAADDKEYSQCAPIREGMDVLEEQNHWEGNREINRIENNRPPFRPLLAEGTGDRHCDQGVNENQRPTKPTASALDL